MTATNINERDRLVRLSAILGTKEIRDEKTQEITKKAIKPLIPVCKATWYAGIKKGIYPQGIRLSPRVVMWRLSEVMAIVNHTSNE